MGIIAQERKDWIETPQGSFKIERFWEEKLADTIYTYTIVSYKNTSKTTFQMVQFKASVRDSNGNIINTNTRSFFEHVVGKIYPGFEDSVKIPVQISTGKAASVSVSIMAK